MQFCGLIIGLPWELEKEGKGFGGKKNLVAVGDSLREFISQSAQCKIVEIVLGLFQPV